MPFNVFKHYAYFKRDALETSHGRRRQWATNGFNETREWLARFVVLKGEGGALTAGLFDI